MSDYPLPAHHLGVEHLAVLDYVCLSATLALPAQTQIPVTLEADNRTGGWRVRSMFGTVGWLTAEEAAEFPDMERLRSAGMTASTTAVVDLDDVAVNLGLAPWHIARNDQPEGTVLLAGGVAAGLDTSMSSDVQSSQIEALGTACVFVQFHHVAGSIVVTVDDAVLGLLGQATDFELLTQLLAQAPIAARAYIADGMVAVDLPADPNNLFAPSVPTLPSLFDAPLIPTPLPTPGEDTEDAMLSFDPSEYLESAEATKPKSQRFLTTPQFDDQPATEAFEALFRKHDLGKPDED
ncbi:MAG: hypothetical protein WAW05_06410 [Corynebacterium casei]